MHRNLLSGLLTLIAGGAVLGQSTPIAPNQPGQAIFPESPAVATPWQTTPPPVVPQPQPVVRPMTMPEFAQNTAEHLTPFDPQRVELTRNGNSWQLMYNGSVLKDCGWSEMDGKQALQLIRDLGLNQHGTVGSPNVVMEYWLHDGKAPHSAANGLPAATLDVASLRVEDHGGNWFMRDSQRTLFDFGPSAADAHQALAILQKYGFSQIVALGQPSPTMLVFLGKGPALPTAPVAPVSFQNPPPPPPSQLPQRDMPAKNSSLPATAPGTNRQNMEVIAQPSSGNAKTEKTAIDWRQVNLKKDSTTWKVMSGDQEVAQFINEHDANMAVSVIQHYRFTERIQVGQGKGRFSYFLSDGKVPVGAQIGVHTELMPPDRLKVVQTGGQWTINNGDRVFLSFGDRSDEAQFVLDVIKKNKCDRLCRIGLSDDYGLTFLARTR